MISVLTLTYQRHGILEEAIHSFLMQDFEDSEMVILNDSPDVIYKFDYPRVRVINYPTRFPSIGKKLEYGFSICKGNFIYRLDDDDLLAPDALSLVNSYTVEKHDIYRCHYAYFLEHNIYRGFSDNINNGNCYSKEYVQRIKFPDVSIIEDVDITFNQGADIFIGDTGKYSMIYRWGMNTYHISGLGVEHANNSNYIFGRVDGLVKKENGEIVLNPHFNIDYYNLIKTGIGN